MKYRSKKMALPLFFLLTSGVFVLALFPPIVAPAKIANPMIMNGSQQQIALEPAKRVVIFPPMLWSYLTVDEGAANVLAVSNFMHKEVANGLLGRIYPASMNIPTALTSGSNTAIPGDTEQLLLLRPDAVFSWAHMSEPLKQAGLPVVEEKLGDSEQNTISLWRLIATVAGKYDRGERLVSRYFEKRDAVERGVAGLNAVEKPTAVFMWVNDFTSMFVAVGNSAFSRGLQIAGAKNLAAEFKLSRLNLEQLLMLNPDVIFLHGTFGKEQTPQFFYDQPELQLLSAVKNKRVYKSPIGGSRMEGLVDEPLLQSWMAELLYPDRLPNKFRDECKETYREVYRYDLSDNEIDKAIFLQENLSSKGYNRFVR
ncbi:MAG TPA: ABC transporter substrate-binding protein [Desulfuromonadaceae bacterium]